MAQPRPCLAGCCQLLQVLLCLLIVVCSSVSCNSTGGYTGLFSLGSMYYYQYGGAYSGFSGADGERAQRLDAQFQQLKVPPAQAAMAVGGALLALTCLLIAVGLVRLPWRCPAWLIAEALLDVAMAAGLVPGLYFYYQHLLSAYSSPVCQERERLYHSKGYTGFDCSLHGAEIAVGLFTGLTIVAFVVSAGLAVRGFRTIQQLQAKPIGMGPLSPCAREGGWVPRRACAASLEGGLWPGPGQAVLSDHVPKGKDMHFPIAPACPPWVSLTS